MSCKPRPNCLRIAVTAFNGGTLDMTWDLTDDVIPISGGITRIVSPSEPQLRAIRRELETAWATFDHRRAVWQRMHPELLPR